MRSHAELKDIALGIATGTIFTSDMISKNEDQGLIGHVFLPLMFMDQAQTDELLADMKSGKVVALYGYLKDAMPHAINGYPMFKEFGQLSGEEARTINEIIKAYHDAVDKL